MAQQNEIAVYRKKYPRVPKRYFKHLIKSANPEDIPLLAELINTRLVYGQDDEHMDTPVCRNFDDHEHLLDVIPECPSDILAIIHEFSVMTQDDIDMELITTTMRDSIHASHKIVLNKSLNWHLQFGVTNAITGRELCTIDLTPKSAVLYLTEMHIHRVDLRVPDLKSQVIKTLRQFEMEDPDTVPAIVHLICLWRSYTM